MTGNLHPLSVFFDHSVAFFERLGFSVLETPEIETTHYHFDTLNIAANHPAREVWDTFFLERGPLHLKALDPNLVLRAHTTSAQGRVMRLIKPPLRVVVPGRVFRRDATDSTHLNEFAQLDGFIVDKEVTMTQLKGVMTDYLTELFPTARLRFVPAHFDFVEPGMEVWMTVGERTIEVVGCGMIHPAVLHNVGIDPKIFKGFAFGFGVDRLVGLLTDLRDIRSLYSTDLRWLKQLGMQ